MRGIHQGLVDSPHKGPVMCQAFPCHDIITLMENPDSNPEKNSFHLEPNHNAHRELAYFPDGSVSFSARELWSWQLTAVIDYLGSQTIMNQQPLYVDSGYSRLSWHPGMETAAPLETPHLVVEAETKNGRHFPDDNEFSWMKLYKSQMRFHWSLFSRVQLMI